eukprot:2673128-Prymnesium_polylepis.3
MRLGAASFCATCLPRTTSHPGSSACAVCIESYYKVVAANATSLGSDDCKTCPSDTTYCAEDTTLATVKLLPRRWRLSGASSEFVKCRTTGSNAGEWSPCKGGSEVGSQGAGYCENGHAGPRVSRACACRIFALFSNPTTLRSVVSIVSPCSASCVRTDLNTFRHARHGVRTARRSHHACGCCVPSRVL